MSEHSWVLKGIDPDTRQKTVAAAEARGVSVAEYLTDVVLQGALAEQFLAANADDPAVAEPSESEIVAPQPQENFAVRHRLEALERRLSLAVGGLDSAVHGLDSSVFGLASRIDDAEILAADTADALQQALADTAANLIALRKRLGDVEDQDGQLSEALDAARTETAERCASLDQRLDAVNDIARAAATHVAQLSVAHEALKYAVADDFSAFAHESAARLNAGLDEVRAAADAAAEQADAAVHNLITELRALRESIEARMADSATETRMRMQAAFADAAERMTSLTDRVVENERMTVRTAEQLRAQIADVEDGAQTALEETAEALRQAGAALAAEFARATQDNRTALESVHSDLSSELAELRERQSGGLARLKLVDAALTNTITDVATLRETVETRMSDGEAQVRALLAEALADVDERFDAFGARLAAGERHVADAIAAQRAETDRVEACAFAALEKLAADRELGDATLEHKLERAQTQWQTEISDMRDLQSGALARLKLIDAALNTQNGDLATRITELEADIAARAIDRGFDERLLRLEALAEGDRSKENLAALTQQISALAAQIEAQRPDEHIVQRMEELRTRVWTYETQAAEAADRVHGVSRMLGRLTAQNADAATQSEERLHKLELALADMRLEHLSSETTAGGSNTGAEIVRALEERVVALEERQAEAFEALRADISHFIGENDRRLQMLESLPGNEQIADVAAEYEVLRKRIEDRIMGVEQRSIRALEQVADTMVVLEQRFGAATDAVAKSA